MSDSNFWKLAGSFGNDPIKLLIGGTLLLPPTIPTSLADIARNSVPWTKESLDRIITALFKRVSNSAAAESDLSHGWDTMLSRGVGKGSGLEHPRAAGLPSPPPASLAGL